MEISESKIAIIGIIVLEISISAMSLYRGAAVDMGTIGMGITAVAGLAGYDMQKKTP